MDISEAEKFVMSYDPSPLAQERMGHMQTKNSPVPPPSAQ